MMGARDLLAACTRDALISECGLFRYWLLRRWADGPLLLFVMLNPSTADANIDDATIRRCATFAHVHGFAGFMVVNLFAFRATDPRELARKGWQVGPDNDDWIELAAQKVGGICVAWGAVGDRGPANDRVQVVVPILRRYRAVQCLRITRSGYPQHPLYLRGDCRLQAWDAAAVQEAMAA
jgi:hypothetical protein